MDMIKVIEQDIKAANEIIKKLNTELTLLDYDDYKGRLLIQKAIGSAMADKANLVSLAHRMKQDVLKSEELEAKIEKLWAEIDKLNNVNQEVEDLSESKEDVYGEDEEN